MIEQHSVGKIFISYHKPYQVLDGDFIFPVHAGKACRKKNKDSECKISRSAVSLDKMAGDDTGDNISARNNEFSECSVLYWAWKNMDFDSMKFVGLFQYRRQLILNDYFEKAKNNFEKKCYQCVHFKKIDKKFNKRIGLTEENILNALKEYDCLVPFATDLEKMDIASPYEDWVRKIPGTHVNDLVALEDLMGERHPELAQPFHAYLNSPKKLMYQIFIAKPEVAKEYCRWLFDILFEVDKRVDSSQYSVNGKRTLGYLAEILYGFYFTYMKDKIKVKECGVSFIDE